MTDQPRLSFSSFDPTRCGFPRPRIPVLPDGAPLRLANRLQQRPASVFDSSHFRHFSRGRYALHEAFRLAGVTQSATLLAPAYHCRTMLDPALALGAQVLLYPLNSDLSPDLDKLDAVLALARKPVRALLAAQFFGIPQSFATLLQRCQRLGITLIEDCSHALLTDRYQAPGIGTYGEFVVSSPYKFFPCPDGGILFSRSANRLAGVRTKPATIANELNGIRHFLQKIKLTRYNPGDAATIDERLATLVARPIVVGDDFVNESGMPSKQYDVTAQGIASLRWSRLVVRNSSPEEVAGQRRENYQRLSRAISGIPNCQPLFPELPPNSVPYMFPLYLDHPEPRFFWLKHLGMPIWRWDDMAASGCAVAGHARLHLLHLPCHQALTSDDLQWMIDVLGQTLRRGTEMH